MFCCWRLSVNQDVSLLQHFLLLLIKVSFRVSFLSDIIRPVWSHYSTHSCVSENILCPVAAEIQTRSKKSGHAVVCSRIIEFVDGGRCFVSDWIEKHDLLKKTRPSINNINHRRKPIWSNDLSKVAFNQCGTFVFFSLLAVGRSEPERKLPAALKLFWFGGRFSALWGKTFRNATGSII